MSIREILSNKYVAQNPARSARVIESLSLDEQIDELTGKLAERVIQSQQESAGH